MGKYNKKPYIYTGKMKNPHACSQYIQELLSSIKNMLLIHISKYLKV